MADLNRIYEITIVRFTPDPTPTARTFSSGQNAVTWLGDPNEFECFIEASVMQDKYCFGDFLLWCSGEYARARINEHRDHDASYTESTFANGKVITFKDEDGSLFTQSGVMILPRQLAIDAIRAWLIDLNHPSFLRWN
ncbi:hypothetical protein [Undibacterium danionis]|uniref:Uncharacterized protein n=1 Tax=Undibacterium danionis TaxID=1812100 RepID=A0ABV6I9V4_9BURK